MPRRPPTEAELRRIARERFLAGRRAERSYRRQLTEVARQVGSLVRGFTPGGELGDLEGMRSALNRYSELLLPWARAVTAGMHADVSRRDASSWTELAKSMGRTLRREIFHSPTGEAMRLAMEEQVSLITSLPRNAAERVHRLTIQAISNAGRASEIQKEILASGHVTESRARTIARTETSRTASLLVQSRANFVGSTHYIWHTSHDSDVRATHRRLDRRVFAWDDPPITEETGERANPGQIWNCRCWAEPILPDEVS
jgi:SPP1 gp7 family putative phage head morphogenesis protein